MSIEYCDAIAALFAEQRKIPRITDDTDRSERWRIRAMNADIHRQQEELQERAAKAFAALNGWRHTERHFSIKTLIRGGAHAARGEWPGYLARTIYSIILYIFARYQNRTARSPSLDSPMNQRPMWRKVPRWHARAGSNCTRRPIPQRHGGTPATLSSFV
jgi:hypothetical protein